MLLGADDAPVCSSSRRIRPIRRIRIPFIRVAGPGGCTLEPPPQPERPFPTTLSHGTFAPMQTRREFLGTLGITAVGAVALGGLKPGQLESLEVAKAKRLPLGIQLYTVRSILEKDFDGTLANVAKAGYKEVEFAGYYGRTPAQVRESLKKHRLSAPSSHIPLPKDDDAWARSLADAKAIGHEWVVIPWLDPSMRKTAADWHRHAERLNHLGEATKKAGLKLGYHNHDFELAKAADGSTYLDMLLAMTDAKLVNYEMDVYWVTKGGGDPLAFFKKYPGRFPLLHLKDATPAPAQDITDVGSGTIDWKKVITAARAQGTKHAFVENDKPADPLVAIRTSEAYLSKLKY
jgi:sugar phosphate isomerase/epimerase